MEFSNPQTKARFRFTGSNWNIRVQIPGVYSGSLERLTPAGAAALIAQGRRNIEEIEAVPAPPDVKSTEIVDPPAGAESSKPKPAIKPGNDKA